MFSQVPLSRHSDANRARRRSPPTHRSIMISVTRAPGGNFHPTKPTTGAVCAQKTMAITFGGLWPQASANDKKLATFSCAEFSSHFGTAHAARMLRSKRPFRLAEPFPSKLALNAHHRCRFCLKSCASFIGERCWPPNPQRPRPVLPAFPTFSRELLQISQRSFATHMNP